MERAMGMFRFFAFRYQKTNSVGSGGNTTIESSRRCFKLVLVHVAGSGVRLFFRVKEDECL
jgi:hypothetical protein